MAGAGPYRVWKNRMKGPWFGVHENAYNNTITGERGWKYPEFKGYFDQMYWAVIENEEYPITVISATDGIYLRLFTPDTPTEGDVKHTLGVFPEGNISFMDAISPVGTKFKKPEQLGPQGQKNQFRHHNEQERIWGATLYFDFGAGMKSTQSVKE